MKPTSRGWGFGCLVPSGDKDCPGSSRRPETGTPTGPIPLPRRNPHFAISPPFCGQFFRGRKFLWPRRRGALQGNGVLSAQNPPEATDPSPSSVGAFPSSPTRRAGTAKTPLRRRKTRLSRGEGRKVAAQERSSVAQERRSADAAGRVSSQVRLKGNWQAGLTPGRRTGGTGGAP